MKFSCLCCSLVLSFVPFLLGAVTDADFTYPNLAYGEHPRQVVDVFLPENSADPVPVLMFVHGGGWTKGERREDPADSLLRKCRAQKLAFLAVEYRFLEDGRAAGLQPPVRAPMDDVAAVIALVQRQAKTWNVDPRRIGLTGGSAGACSSLAVAFAEGNHLGIRAVGALWPQTSLDPQEMKEWIPNIGYGGQAFGYRDFADWLAHREESLPWIRRYSPAGLIRACPAERMPTVLTEPYVRWKPDAQLPNDPTHAHRFREKLGELCKEKGGEFIEIPSGKLHDALIRVLKR